MRRYSTRGSGVGRGGRVTGVAGRVTADTGGFLVRQLTELLLLLLLDRPWTVTYADKRYGTPCIQ